MVPFSNCIRPYPWKNESQISYISKTLNPQLKLYTMQHFFPKTSFFFFSPLYSLISRHYSSFPRLPKLRGIPYKQRANTIHQAQQALIDYLYATRSLSFNHAENISKNSLFSLSDLISKIDFTPSTFPRDFKRFLSYHPINEFEFFFESIGIPHSEINGYLPANEFFLSEEGAVLNAARALLTFGFPWNKLGTLYKEEISIFSKDSETLTARIFEFKSLGFDTVSVVGICLAFPYVLRGDDELSDEVDSLFYDLKRVFTEFDLVSAVQGNVDAWHEICRKIRLFYDLGCEKGKMGELIGRGKSVILNYPEQVLVEKFEFFCRLNTRKKEDVGLLILRYPEILDFDLENPVISVLGFLKHLGLSEEELNSISLNYPFVLGKNRLRNLPHLMRVLDLHEWFFNKIMNGDYRLLANFDIDSPNEEMENDFRDFLKTIRSTKNHNHTMGKLEFLYGIGFGENKATIKALSYLHGTRNELQERFDCLLHTGMEFSKLTRLVSMWPKILNQNVDNLEHKVNYLCNEMGCTLQYLDVFPGYLCFDLENRIKPRYKMHLWLTEKGLIKRHYSIASIFATSEKKFIARLFTIHPAVPKQWLEHFSSKRDSHSLQETEV